MEVKHRINGKILYKSEKKTIKETMIDAVENCADLGGADLGGADLGGAYLRGADLRGADLRGAYLRDADLRGADLRDADLRDAYLGGADLGGAYLGGADLRGANLYCITLSEKVKETLIKELDWKIIETKTERGDDADSSPA